MMICDSVVALVFETLHELRQLELDHGPDKALSACELFQSRLSKWQLEDQREDVLIYLHSIRGTNSAVCLKGELLDSDVLFLVRTIDEHEIVFQSCNQEIVQLVRLSSCLEPKNTCHIWSQMRRQQPRWNKINCRRPRDRSVQLKLLSRECPRREETRYEYHIEGIKLVATMALADTRIAFYKPWHAIYGWVLCDLIRRLRLSASRFTVWSIVREIQAEHYKLPFFFERKHNNNNKVWWAQVRSVTDELIVLDFGQHGVYRYSWARTQAGFNIEADFEEICEQILEILDFTSLWTR